MPYKDFLEQYPLYKKYKVEVPSFLDDLPTPAINMNCSQCDAQQTFNIVNSYWEDFKFSNVQSGGRVIRSVYKCSSCKAETKYFFMSISSDKASIVKVGQYPAWEIQGNQELESMLGTHASYYKRGLVCESQGYGIAAFAYYRRIVEEVIDTLLMQISDLMTIEEKKAYDPAIEKTKKTIVTAEKIALVKDLLPPVLRPDGHNPLNLLHQMLSEGLHAQTDEACLESAAIIRGTLIFLVRQISVTSNAQKSFTEHMKKLLQKKSSA